MERLKQISPKTRKTVGAVAGALVIVAVVLITLSLTIWAQPNKQDFEAAKKDGEKIVADYQASKKLNEFSKAVTSEGRAGKTSGELVKTVADEKKAVVDMVNSRRAIADKTSESRVVRDEEVKKAFETYYATEKTYDAYYLGYVDAFPRYYSSLLTCIKLYQIGSKTRDNKEYAAMHKDASKLCLEDLNALSKSSIQPYAKYAKEGIRIVTERQKVFDEVANDSQAANQAAVDKIKQLSSDNAKNDPTDELSALVKKSSFDGQLTAFIAVLDKKAKAAN